MDQKQYSKPVPPAQPESDFYWEKAKQHELWLRKCNGCQRAYFYPRDICPTCFSRDTGWIKASGKGTLHTFAIVHRAPTPAFKGDVPYVVAFVDLEEGPRMPTNLVGVEPDPSKIRVGMPVEVVFEDITDKIALPKFKPVMA